MRIVSLDENSKKNILNDLLKRSPNNYDEFAGSVNEILNNVRNNGNKALFEYTKKFDGADINPSNMILEAETVKIYWSAPIFTDVVSYFAGAILLAAKRLQIS